MRQSKGSYASVSIAISLSTISVRLSLKQLRHENSVKLHCYKQEGNYGFVGIAAPYFVETLYEVVPSKPLNFLLECSVKL
jgi:hypothetical protein